MWSSTPPWLGEQISTRFGSVSRTSPVKWIFTATIKTRHPTCPIGAMILHYSHERSGLRRGAGNRRWYCARPTLALPTPPGQGVWVAAGDILRRISCSQPKPCPPFGRDDLAHLWLVPNPEHNPRGDFGPRLLGLVGAAQRRNELQRRGPRPLDLQHHRAVPGHVVCPPWCSDIPAGNPQGLRVGLASVLRRAMDQGRVHPGCYRTLVGRPASAGSQRRQQPKGLPCTRPSTSPGAAAREGRSCLTFGGRALPEVVDFAPGTVGGVHSLGGMVGTTK